MQAVGFRWNRSAVAKAMLAVGLALSAGMGHAGLFEDDEARKYILELRKQVQQNDESQKAQLAAAVRQLTEQLQTLQRSLLEMNNQNEQLRAEIARLRGQDEQLQRDIAELQRRQRDMSQTLEDRVRKLEPQKVSVDGKDFLAEPDEKRAYEEAMEQLRAGDFDKAGFALSAFLKRYPSSGYGDSARYWLANAQYARRDYKEAVATFRAFLTAAPDHARAPEAWLATGNCYVEMKDTKTARRVFEDLIKQFPKSEAAGAAKERLSALK
jgi:tol-pal system protein YbgF